MPNFTSGPKYATLTGLAVGDALGMPFEKMRHGDPALGAWDGRTFLPGNWHKLEAGRWTDDTSMAWALAESLLERKGLAPDDVANKYLDWYHDEFYFNGAGKTTKAALHNLDTGCPWFASGIPRAEGNGPAMRVAPLGLFYHRAPDRVILRAAEVEATITHDSDVAREGAVAIAMATALLARGLTKPAQVIERVLPYLPDQSQMHFRLVAANTKVRSTEPTALVLDRMGAKFHILETVPAALLAVARSTNFQEAVEASIRAGGDTDTTAAIAGALAGTYYGIEQVARYLPGLHQAEQLRASECRLFTEGLKVEGPIDWR
jgi:ADP-ribosylglycohydrolase